MKKLWIIPTVIISLNIIIVIFGFATNSGTIGSWISDTIGLIFDPMILVSSLILGLLSSSKDIKLYLLTAFGVFSFIYSKIYF